MTSTLYVAAGGGGDAIAATILARRDDPESPAHVATYSWDRLLIDPVPGPRGRDGFTGLIEHAPNVAQIVPETTAVPNGGSTLPRLAKELPAHLYLLDPSKGAIGLAEQITQAGAHIRADKIVLVDVGGDLVAIGDENDLRSPLADFLALAACTKTAFPSEVLIAGPGLDGELPTDYVIQRCHELGAATLVPLDRSAVKGFRALLDWHPSEVTGLLIAAAQGRRGVVEVRDAGKRVQLDNHSSAAFSLPTDELTKAGNLTQALVGTRSLAEAEATIRELCGASEIDYERIKATELNSRQSRSGTRPSFIEIEKVSTKAARRGADYVTFRRLAELVRWPITELRALHQLLAHDGRGRLDPPLWQVR